MHFLHFARPDYATKGNLIKCNPAIKEVSDREAITAALADDVLDVLATDHAPHTWEEKQKPYAQAPPACHWCSTRWWPRWSACTKAS